ncbi:MAG: complex I NDUFA9 subunit family protein [Acetobacterales bacterium]
MIVVFGGSGFLGAHIIGHLLRAGRGVRVATRHPERVRRPPEGPADPPFEAVKADVHRAEQVAATLDGAEGAVNAVSLYVEHGGATFRSVHVEGARTVARQAAKAGVGRLVHLSGIGSDPRSEARYIRARGRGEEAVREALPEATLFRPSVMFGPDDGLLTTLDGITRSMPVIPLFGSGSTRLQPVYVGDVAAAAERALALPEASGRTYELGGPEVMTYRVLVRRVLTHTGRRRLLVPVPFSVWTAMARAAAAMPSPPITVDQVELMRRDNVAAPDIRGLPDLGLGPTPVGDILPGVVPGRPGVTPPATGRRRR